MVHVPSRVGSVYVHYVPLGHAKVAGLPEDSSVHLASVVSSDVVKVEDAVEVGEVVLVEEGAGVGWDGGHAAELAGRGRDGVRDEVVAASSSGGAGAGWADAAARGVEERAEVFEHRVDLCRVDDCVGRESGRDVRCALAVEHGRNVRRGRRCGKGGNVGGVGPGVGGRRRRVPFA